MADETDFLILYDHAPADIRRALLDAFFEHPEDRQAFLRIVENRLIRARMELEFNQCLSFADFLLLRTAGYARAEEFVSRADAARGREFPAIVACDRHREDTIAVPGLDDACAFFGPFVEAYLCRHTGIGIVMTRDTLEAALDIADAEILALVVDPEFGEPMFDDFRPRPLPGDIRDHRRSMLAWWSVLGRGVEVHDLAKPGGIPERTPRGLACDAAALRVLRNAGR